MIFLKRFKQFVSTGPYWDRSVYINSNTYGNNFSKSPNCIILTNTTNQINFYYCISYYMRSIQYVDINFNCKLYKQNPICHLRLYQTFINDIIHDVNYYRYMAKITKYCSANKIRIVKNIDHNIHKGAQELLLSIITYIDNVAKRLFTM